MKCTKLKDHAVTYKASYKLLEAYGTSHLEAITKLLKQLYAI